MSFIKLLPSVERFPLVLSRHALKRGYHSIRKMMTKESEDSLRNFALLQPQLSRALLKQINHLGNRVQTIVFPAALVEVQNREIARKLGSDPAFIAQLVDEKGVLDLRKAGLKLKMQVVDHTINFKPMTIEDYVDALGKANGDLQSNAELGDLFLFKAVLRARIDLYTAGEKRSAQLRNGETPGVTPELQRVKGFLDALIEQFPFGTISWRQTAREKLQVASLMIGQKKNVAADATLVGIFNYIERIVTGQVVERTRLAPRVVKLTYAGKGTWNLGTTGYRSTEVGFNQKIKTESNVHTPELLSMVQHVIDSVRAETAKNAQFLADLKELETTLPDNFGRLLEIFDEFQAYDALQKDKACAELEGAVQLAPIGTEQSLRLARDLVSMAGRDIELRQTEIAAHEERFTLLYVQAEADVGRKLTDFIRNVLNTMGDRTILSEPALMRNAADRVGAYLGTMLKGEMREMWLRRVKSRFTGLTKTLRKLTGEIARKKEFMGLVTGQRDLYMRLRAEIWQSRGKSAAEKTSELAALKEVTIEGVKSSLAVIGQIDREAAAKVRRAAEFILLAELDFSRRNEEKTAKTERLAFLGTRKGELATMDRLLADRVEAISHDGQLLGRVSRSDAIAMELQYRELKS